MQAVVTIQNVFRITGVGAVPIVRVESGTLKPGMQLNLNGKVMAVKTIEQHHEQLQEANGGMEVGLSLSDGDYGLLKGLTGRQVTFSDDGKAVTKVAVAPEPIRPQGFLGSLTGMFRR